MPTKRNRILYGAQLGVRVALIASIIFAAVWWVALIPQMWRPIFRWTDWLASGVFLFSMGMLIGLAVATALGALNGALIAATLLRLQLSAAQSALVGALIAVMTALIVGVANRGVIIPNNFQTLQSIWWFALALYVTCGAWLAHKFAIEREKITVQI